MDKDIVMWIIGGLFIVIGWLMSRKINELEKADASHISKMEAQDKVIADLKDEKAALKLHIAENYIKRDEIKEYMDDIKNSIEKIFDRLDKKADK